MHDLAAEALAAGVATVRLPPAADPYPVLVAAAALGPILVVGPVSAAVRRLGLRLRRAGLPVALMPDDWATARAGAASVFGTRAAAWAPIARPAAVVVLDEHDQSLQQEQAPTWHARDVLVERARRLGVPLVMVSPAPSLEALEMGPLLVPSRAAERAGWPLVEVVDRRGAPPGEGLFSERFVQALRGGGRVVCVLNRKGRSRLSSCANCGEVATCERCQAAVVQAEEGTLSCPRCGTVRPVVCTHCGALKVKNLRAGVSRVREELEALVREPVAEMTADVDQGAGGTGTRVVVGTEAALHQVDRADVVAFLDLDQELLAPRYRAAEESLGLLVRAARLRRRSSRRRSTPAPDPSAPARGRPGRAARRPRPRRRRPRPIAAVSWPTRRPRPWPWCRARRRPAWVAAFGHPAGVEVLGPADGRWLLRAPDHDTLCAAMAGVTRPPGRVRLEVDPLRL